MPKQPPSEQELALIVAAVEAVWPRPVVIDPRANKRPSPSWRFSGRAWGPPPAASRGRPTFYA